jgi:hypothetical protein
MRTPIAAALLALCSLVPLAPGAEEPAVIDLTVGESVQVGGFRPLCDDSSVAAFASDGSGDLKGLKPGETTCSVSRGSPLGLRQVYRIVVRPASKDRERQKGKPPSGG